MGGGWVREGGGKETWVPDGAFPPPSCICGIESPRCGPCFTPPRAGVIFCACQMTIAPRPPQYPTPHTPRSRTPSSPTLVTRWHGIGGGARSDGSSSWRSSCSAYGFRGRSRRSGHGIGFSKCNSIWRITRGRLGVCKSVLVHRSLMRKRWGRSTTSRRVYGQCGGARDYGGLQARRKRVCPRLQSFRACCEPRPASND